MKVFLCSTSFDLEDLRAMIVHRFGNKHEFIHFEDAAFPSRRGLHSHDQCIEAVKQADVVLCIIDRRYGGSYRGDKSGDFPEQKITFKAEIGEKEKVVEVTIPTRNLSISWCELITAYSTGKYVITFARQRTLDEKASRRSNQGIKKFNPAHVDDERVFDLLDWITKQRKDNWIIPFHNAVDLENKLAKWLEVAGESIVPPHFTTSPTSKKPISILVEGKMDGEVISLIAQKLNLTRPISIISTNGKRQLINGMKHYVNAFKESIGVIALMDADTENIAEIEAQKAQINQLISGIKGPPIHVIFAVPHIEAWLVSQEYMKKHSRGLNQINYELHTDAKKLLQELQDELETRASRISELKVLIDLLTSLDAASDFSEETDE